ncbi:MAG: hypothetical protein HQK65_09010 [Desulfamplus sp.]|nr:hypothetical protein [Desulfamplus sp.]
MTKEIKNQSFVKYVEVPKPDLGNNTADVERLKSALAKEIETDTIFFPTGLVSDFAIKLRQWNHRVKVVLFKDSRGWRVVDLLEPDIKLPVLGIAADLGTTRIVLRLINLESTKTCAEIGFDNPQASIAPDVLARIHHARTQEGLKELQQLVISAFNKNIHLLCMRHAVESISSYGQFQSHAELQTG